MRKTLFFIVQILFIIVALASGQVTVIKADALLNPETDEISTDQVIIIEGAKIIEVGNNLTIPEGAVVLDLSGKTVLPGMIDSHTHLCLGMSQRRHAGNPTLTQLSDSTPFRAIQGVVHAKEMLEAGFTTVRDVGNAGNWADIALKRAINEGLVPGPTLLVAGKIITPFGGQSRHQPEVPWIDDMEYIYADTRDELRKAIRENTHYGADLVKIVVDDQPYIYSADDIRFIVEEAASAGLYVAAHTVTDRGARSAIEGGIHSIEHGWNMSSKTLELAKAKNIVMVSTELTVDVLLQYNIPRSYAEMLHNNVVDRMKRAYEIGVTVAFGSDIMMDVEGKTRGQLALSLIDSFVESGVPNHTILQYMITNPARLLGMEESRGAIKPGFFADIIATDENPLENIDALKNVAFVMKNGTVIKQ